MMWQKGERLLATQLNAALNARGILASDYGVKADGITDDTAAFRAALLATTGGVLRFSGNILLTEPVTVPSRTSLIGDGHQKTRITGNFADGDILYAQTVDALWQGFRVTSAVKKTSGAAIHWYGSGRSTLRDVWADGSVGNGNLYHGFWLDGVDNCHGEMIEAWAQQDAIRINGLAGAGQPKANFFLRNGRALSSGVGLHVGGAFGGLHVDAFDFINNGINGLIDTTVVAENNREIFFNPGVFFDGATVAGVRIDQSIGSNAFVNFAASWIASTKNAGPQLDVVNWPNSVIRFDGGTIFNGTGDGVVVRDATARVRIGTEIRNNAGTGINATVSTSNVIVLPSTAFYGNGATVNANVAGAEDIYNPVLRASGGKQVARVGSLSGANSQVLLRSGVDILDFLLEGPADGDIGFTPTGTGLFRMNSIVRTRVYTKATLPTGAKYANCHSTISDPAAGKSRLVTADNSGSAWYYQDGTPV